MEAVKSIKERNRIKRGVFFVEQDVKLPQANNVLAVTSDVNLTGEECVDGEIRISGKIEYKIVFEHEDGTLDCIVTAKDFLEKISDKGLKADTQIAIELSAVENEYTGTDPLRIRTTVEIDGWYAAEKQICSVAADGLAEVLCKTKSVEIESVSILPSTIKEVAKEIEIVGGVDRVLCAQTNINIVSVACATEIAYIDAELTSSIFYVKDNCLYQETIVSPFTAELTSADIMPESIVLATAQTTSASVSVADEKTVLVEVSAMIRGSVTTIESISLVTDAYSVKFNTEVKFAKHTLTHTACKETLSDKLSGSVRVAPDSGTARSIVGNTKPSIAGLTIRVEDGRILVAEGVMSSRVLYLDNAGKPHSVLIEAPFQLTGARECAMAEVLCSTASALGFNSRIRLGDEIEYSATIEISVEGQTKKEISSVETCIVLDEREADDTAISLYIVAEGETLWDVAKELLSDEAAIMQQNPELELPLKGGEHIISYKEL